MISPCWGKFGFPWSAFSPYWHWYFLEINFRIVKYTGIILPTNSNQHSNTSISNYAFQLQSLTITHNRWNEHFHKPFPQFKIPRFSLNSAVRQKQPKFGISNFKSKKALIALDSNRSPFYFQSFVRIRLWVCPMYLEEIILDGFKSYANRTVISGFDSRFNAITGLNGSGKSNILDAICFVLGITNLSQVWVMDCLYLLSVWILGSCEKSSRVGV